MKRKFRPFDEEVLRKEFAALPAEDKKALSYAMQCYQRDLGVSYTIDSYGKGLMMIKGTGQGRCLFFSVELTKDAEGNEVETLVALLFYKKETQKAPQQVIDRATERMKTYKKKEK